MAGHFTVVAVEREGHPDQVAVPAADVEAVGAPALIRRRHLDPPRVRAIPTADLSRQRQLVDPHHAPDPLAVVRRKPVLAPLPVDQDVDASRSVAAALAHDRHDREQDFAILEPPVEATRTRPQPQVGGGSGHVQHAADGRGRSRGHRLDPLNKCGLFFTTSRAASRISIVTACFPMMRWRSLICFSSSRTRLTGTTSSPASTAAALPLSLSLIHRRIRAGATLSSRESAATVVSPDRILSTACRLNSVVKILRPSDFLSKSPISTHLACPLS